VPSSFQGITLTRIGTITKGPAGKVFHHGKPLGVLGYDHFRVR